MKASPKRAPLAERLKESLNDGIEFARGKQNLVTTLVPAGRTYTGSEVAEIRTRRHMTQAQFAMLLAVNIKTLQSWEQGVRKPSNPTMRLLQIFDEPGAFKSILTEQTP
jgi:putative transcriptional regulator